MYVPRKPKVTTNFVTYTYTPTPRNTSNRIGHTHTLSFRRKNFVFAEAPISFDQIGSWIQLPVVALTLLIQLREGGKRENGFRGR